MMLIYRKCRICPGRRGVAIVYLMIMLVALTALGSLAIDFARVQTVKTELENAADAAARAGAYALVNSSAQAQSLAIAAAADNLADGSPVVLANSDVAVGNWTSGVFTANGTPSNAIQVTATRTAAKGNAVPLLFGRLCGATALDVHASAIALATAEPSGFVGLNGITVDKKLFSASYDSTVTTSPSRSNYVSSGLMQTNGPIGQSSHAGCWIYGDLNLGPAGVKGSGINVSGSTTVLAQALTATEPTMQVIASNPGGVSRTPSIGTGTTANWPGGTYYFTSLTIADTATINFSGAATLCVDGNATLGSTDTITAYNSTPSNLQIYQSTGHTLTGVDNITLVGRYVGPGCTISFNQWTNLQGSVVAGTFNLFDNDALFYDTSMGGAVVNISLVK